MNNVKITENVKSSIIYNSNPLLKFALFISTIVLSIISANYLALTSTLILLTIVYVFSKISFYRYLKLSISVIPMFLIIFLFNLLFLPNAYESVYYAGLLTLRLFVILVAGQIFIRTTETRAIAWTFTMILYPLKYIKVPIHKISLMLTMSLTFVPVLIDDYKTILDSLKLKELDIEGNNILVKVKTIKNSITPFFVMAFKRAQTMSDSLIIRNFEQSNNHTTFRKYSFNINDIFVLLILTTLILIMIFI